MLAFTAQPGHLGNVGQDQGGGNNVQRALFLALFASPFKSKSRLEAENAALRHQLIISRRKVRGRVRLTNGDRLFFIKLYRCFPSVLKWGAARIIETPG
jgi:hypothetical protein